MQTVPLGGAKANGRIALVDDADYDLVMGHRWRIETTTSPSLFYVVTKIYRPDLARYKMTYMHTLLTGWPMTDHIDHDGLNNQRYNLRPATRAQNMMNKRRQRHSGSRFKGVERLPSRSYRARIALDGKRLSLGCFDDDVSAALAYDAAALRYFGEFACLNFPDGHSVLPSNGIAPS